MCPLPREIPISQRIELLKKERTLQTQFGKNVLVSRAEPTYRGVEVVMDEIFALHTGVVTIEQSASPEVVDAFANLASSVESMQQELALYKKTIDGLSEALEGRPIIRETRLFDIDETLDVIQPIPVVVEEFGDEVIASFPELEVFAVASNEPQAISALKAEIRDLYYDLAETPINELGRLPQSWLRILGKLVRRVGDA